MGKRVGTRDLKMHQTLELRFCNFPIDAVSLKLSEDRVAPCDQ